MKLSRKFVSEYIDIPVDTKTLAEDMTNIGNEYDSCETLISATNLTIGEIIECIDHPDSDHLHVCSVNIGTEILQIICGAPNARKGIKVIVALNGAQLPGGTIKKSNIRGVESNGMLCALDELGLDHKFLRKEDVNGICELPSDAIVGEDPIQYLMLDDEIIDFELTSNRGDLLSILGMAYEIGALYDKKVKEIDLSFTENKNNIADHFHLKIETENCPLFLCKRVENVTIKESPAFIKNRLIASGIRPINNVVDISNYVMLETGQPLHFYDADRLGDTLVVRMANNNEKLITLDNEERVLSNNDIVISDKEKAVGLAGVMGGLTTEIENTSKNVMIEAAIFNPILVRKTSKKIIRSEASNRFEKGLDPKRSYMAILRSCHLLEKYADATIVGGMIEHNTLDMNDKTIEIPSKYINKILGIEIPKEEMISILERLGFTVTIKEDILEVLVPTRRIDLSIKEDIVEEVGRIYGIDNIKGKELILPIKPGNFDKTKRLIRNKLTGLGLNETLSYTLISEKDVHKFTIDEFEHVKILDPMTEERTTLRYSLIPSLLSIYEYNKARNYKDICLYEIGKSFYKKNDQYGEEDRLAVLMTGNYYLGLKNEKVDFYIIKGVLEEVLDYLGYANRYTLNINTQIKELHPGVSATIELNNQSIGYIGKVHPGITKDEIYVFEIELEKLLKFRTSAMSYKEYSKYPSIEKDIAFIIKKDIMSDTIKATIKKSGGKLLTNIKVFDVYTGENVGVDEKSIAYKLTFSDPNKTLSDEEIMVIFNKIIEDVTKKHNAVLRDK